MGRFGNCVNCGSVMQSPSICTYCDEEAMISLQSQWDKDNDTYPDWTMD